MPVTARLKTHRTCLAGLCLFAMAATAQQTIGTLKTEDATITGMVVVQQGQAQIQNSGTITAGHKAVDVSLTRGGQITVCMGSTAQLSQGSASKSPLMMSLNHGAFEVKMDAVAQDVVITPDLRFDLSNAAPLDLRVRVTPEGDTCVENRGKDAPVLHITEQFGGGGYFVKAGQSVLFEHASVREVVDHEHSSCGCPKAVAVVNGNSRDPNPFPESVSQGLEQPKVPASTPGETHTQVSATLSYNGTQPTEAAAPSVSSAPVVAADVPASAPAKKSGNFVSSIGHFFRRLFGGGS